MKNAEILMRRTGIRLNAISHNASQEDQGNPSTLKQLDQVQTELIMEVFERAVDLAECFLRCFVTSYDIEFCRRGTDENAQNNK